MTSLPSDKKSPGATRAVFDRSGNVLLNERIAIRWLMYYCKINALLIFAIFSVHLVMSGPDDVYNNRKHFQSLNVFYG